MSGGVGGGKGHGPRRRPGPGVPASSATRSSSPSTAAPRREARASVSGWRSPRGSSRPTAESSACRPIPPTAPPSPSPSRSSNSRRASDERRQPRVLVVDDEPQIIRGPQGDPDATRATASRRRPPRRRRSTPSRSGRPMRSSSTWSCRTATASRSAPRSAAGARSRSSCSRRWGTSARRSARSTRAPTTTSPSRSAARSCSPGCAPCSGGATEDGDSAVRVGDLEIDLADRAGEARRGGGPPDPDRVRPARQLAEHPRHGWSPTGSCSRRSGGPGTRTRRTTCASTSPTSARSSSPTRRIPRYVITEPGIGYRLRAEA